MSIKEVKIIIIVNCRAVLVGQISPYNKLSVSKLGQLKGDKMRHT